MTSASLCRHLRISLIILWVGAWSAGNTIRSLRSAAQQTITERNHFLCRRNESKGVETSLNLPTKRIHINPTKFYAFHATTGYNRLGTWKTYSTCHLLVKKLEKLNHVGLAQGQHLVKRPFKHHLNDSNVLPAVLCQVSSKSRTFDFHFQKNDHGMTFPTLNLLSTIYKSEMWWNVMKYIPEILLPKHKNAPSIHPRRPGMYLVSCSF